jgi:hypothetical protein
MLNFLRSFFYSRIQKWRRTLLLIVLAAITFFGWLRAAEAIKGFDYLIQLGLNPHPLYYVISGSLIGLLFLIAFAARIIKLAWSRRFIHFCAIFLGLLFIIEEVFISINKAGILSIVVKLLLVAALFLLPEKLKEN